MFLHESARLVFIKIVDNVDICARVGPVSLRTNLVHAASLAVSMNFNYKLGAKITLSAVTLLLLEP